MFSHKLRFLFIFLLASYSFFNILFVDALEAYRVHVPYQFVYLFFLFIVFFIWESNRFLDKYLEKRSFKNKNMRWAWMFSGSLGLTVLSTLVPFFIFYFYFNEFVERDMFFNIKLALTFGFRINLFLNTLNLIFVYLRQMRLAQLEAEEIKKISIQAQLQSLKNQVNPHFLFNNLNVLSALIQKDADLATEFIQQFSTVYRYVLQNQDKELTSLSNELGFLNSYLYLLKTRFDGSLDIILSIEEESRKLYILPVALQMLIENAIKHNICSKNKPLKIELFTEGIDWIVVKNNLQIKEVFEGSTKIGLNNIAKRYEHVSDRKVEVIEENGSFIVKLPLINIIES